jgi:predicted enzyme related to lactoylglutathione lyase
MTHAINWFEIPVADMQRAAKFYGAIFDTSLDVGPAGEGYEMAMFPAQEGVGGALMWGESYAPSRDGALVYLNGNPDLSAALGRVEAAGGKILVPKTNIGQHGFYAVFLDTEGNRVALHSNA